MTEQELKELFKDLEEKGLEPMLCDTPVPLYTCGVPAGIPQEPGDFDGEYIMLLRKLVGYDPTIAIVVKGKSMQGAGIEDGDVVTIRLGAVAEDGDQVVAMLDGEATLKTFFRDEDGEAWLLPHNETFQPIRASEFCLANIIGKVILVQKNVKRVSYRSIEPHLRKAKREKENLATLTDSRLRQAITQFAQQMTNNRHWFCVYRVLVDKGYLNEGDFQSLHDTVNRLLPDNDFNINPKDLSRMDTGSFHKRLFFWEENDAPVQGRRFHEYKSLAIAFQEML